jgi:hypothetical protein
LHGCGNIEVTVTIEPVPVDVSEDLIGGFGVVYQPLLSFEAVGKFDFDRVVLVGPSKRAGVVEANLIP